MVAAMHSLRMRVLFFSDSKFSSWAPTRHQVVAGRRQASREAEEAEERAEAARSEEARKAALRTDRPKRFERQPEDTPRTHPRARIAKVLERALDAMAEYDGDGIFGSPVDREMFHDYDYHVKKPVDLATIRLRVEAYQYGSVEEFKQDTERIVHNSMAYNGIESEITAIAKEMVVEGYEEIKEYPKVEAWVEQARAVDVWSKLRMLLEMQGASEVQRERMRGAMLAAGTSDEQVEHAVAAAVAATQQALALCPSLDPALDAGEVRNTQELEERVVAGFDNSDSASIAYVQSLVKNVVAKLEAEDAGVQASCDLYLEKCMSDTINEAVDGDEEEQAPVEEAKRTPKKKEKKKKKVKKRKRPVYEEDSDEERRKKAMDKKLGRTREVDDEYHSDLEVASSSSSEEEEGDDEEDSEHPLDALASGTDESEDEGDLSDESEMDDYNSIDRRRQAAKDRRAMKSTMIPADRTDDPNKREAVSIALRGLVQR